MYNSHSVIRISARVAKLQITCLKVSKVIAQVLFLALGCEVVKISKGMSLIPVFLIVSRASEGLAHETIFLY